MPFNLKVGGAWKQGTGAQVKVGGAWKTVESIQVKVGGAWKVAFTNSITPTITATVTPNPSSFTQDVTISGFVLPAPTGGTVLVRDIGSNPVGTAVNVNTTTGAYSVTIPDQAVGTYDFSVSYSGFDLYQEVFTNVTVNVGTIPTTTSITRSAATYVFNQTRVTISGTVTPAPSSGTVTISSPAQGTIATVGVDAITGAYSTLTPVRDVGSYTTISALYSGGGNFASSASGTTSYSVTQASTSLAAATSSASVQAGNSVTLSGTLTTAGVNLSGRTITFQGLNASSAWVSLGTGATNASGVATFAWTAVSGYTQIRAVYAGELNYSAQTSAGVAISIFTTIATTTSIARSAASYTYNGTRVTISGTVSPTPTGGTVTIKSGTTTLATATVSTSTGAYSAVMPVQNASTTAYTVTSEYSGFGGVYLASTSGSTSYTVDKAGTAITAPAGFTNNFGTEVTSSTTLTTGGVAFSGQTVVFQRSIDSGATWTTVESRTTDANGNASTTWTPNNSNTNRIRAVHNGSTNYDSSTSGSGTIYLRTVKTGSVNSVSLSPNNFRFFGCNVNEAEAVSTSFSMPAAPAGAVDLSLTGLTVRVSGTDGESGSVRLCVWENTNAQGTYTGALIAASGFIRPRNRSRGQANIEDQFASLSGALRFGGSYLAGFWREDNNCSYTTQFAYNSSTGPEVYYDNSMGSPEGFNRSVTFDSTATLIFTVDYAYYS
jgi:hypothetical protein